MFTVREILQSKDSKLWTIGTTASVFEALELMAEKNIGSLLVMENKKMQGIFSERDYARGIVLKGKSSKQTKVGELMTKEVIYVAPDDRLKECMALMTSKRVRHLPVYQDGELIGILSIGDLVKQIISDQEFTIRELEKYITGSY
jgi:signal-transduction protein with cAMP-binding, CBS, and nucleotidyltransferase domain